MAQMSSLQWCDLSHNSLVSFDLFDVRPDSAALLEVADAPMSELAAAQLQLPLALPNVSSMDMLTPELRDTFLRRAPSTNKVVTVGIDLSFNYLSGRFDEQWITAAGGTSSSSFRFNAYGNAFEAPAPDFKFYPCYYRGRQRCFTPALPVGSSAVATSVFPPAVSTSHATELQISGTGFFTAEGSPKTFWCDFLSGHEATSSSKRRTLATVLSDTEVRCSSPPHQDLLGKVPLRLVDASAGAGAWGGITLYPLMFVPGCPPGFRASSAPGAQLACSQCAAGRAAREFGSTECEDCPPGTSAAKPGSTECAPCEKRRFAAKSGSWECQLCRPGTFGNSSGLPLCHQCPAGRFAPNLDFETTAEECEPCPKGQFAQLPGASACQPCPALSFTDQEASTSCQQCAPHSRSSVKAATSSSDCLCDEGYYGPAGGPCLPCPAGALCVGMTTDPPRAMAGYWTAAGEEFLQCIPFEACLGFVEGSNSNSSCREGYFGQLCGSCIPLEYYRLDGLCRRCPEGAIFMWLLLVFVAFVVTAGLIAMSKPSDSKLYSPQIGIGFVQIVSLYANLTVRWPPLVVSSFSYASVVNLNLDLFSPECSIQMDFWRKYAFKLALPAAAAVVFALVFASMPLAGVAQRSLVAARNRARRSPWLERSVQVCQSWCSVAWRASQSSAVRSAGCVLACAMLPCVAVAAGMRAFCSHCVRRPCRALAGAASAACRATSNSLELCSLRCRRWCAGRTCELCGVTARPCKCLLSRSRATALHWRELGLLPSVSRGAVGAAGLPASPAEWRALAALYAARGQAEEGPQAATAGAHSSPAASSTAGLASSARARPLRPWAKSPIGPGQLRERKTLPPGLGADIAGSSACSGSDEESASPSGQEPESASCSRSGASVPPRPRPPVASPLPKLPTGPGNVQAPSMAHRRLHGSDSRSAGAPRSWTLNRAEGNLAPGNSRAVAKFIASVLQHDAGVFVPSGPARGSKSKSLRRTLDPAAYERLRIRMAGMGSNAGIKVAGLPASKGAIISDDQSDLTGESVQVSQGGRRDPKSSGLTGGLSTLAERLAESTAGTGAATGQAGKQRQAANRKQQLRRQPSQLQAAWRNAGCQTAAGCIWSLMSCRAVRVACGRAGKRQTSSPGLDGPRISPAAAQDTATRLWHLARSGPAPADGISQVANLLVEGLATTSGATALRLQAAGPAAASAVPRQAADTAQREQLAASVVSLSSGQVAVTRPGGERWVIDAFWLALLPQTQAEIDQLESLEFSGTPADRLVYAAATLVTVAYTFLSATAIQAITCVPSGSKLVLKAETTVGCFEGDYWDWFPLVLGVNLVYTVGAPILVAVVLLAFKRQGKLHTPQFEARFGVLTLPFTRHAWWWTIVDMGRKLGMVLVVAYGSDGTDRSDSTVTQIVAAVIISLSIGLLRLMMSPYRLASLNRAAGVTSLAEIFILFNGVIFQSGQVSALTLDILAVVTAVLIAVALAVVAAAAVAEVQRNRKRMHVLGALGLTSYQLDAMVERLFFHVFPHNGESLFREWTQWEDDQRDALLKDVVALLALTPAKGLNPFAGAADAFAKAATASACGPDAAGPPQGRVRRRASRRGDTPRGQSSRSVSRVEWTGSRVEVVEYMTNPLARRLSPAGMLPGARASVLQQRGQSPWYGQKPLGH